MINSHEQVYTIKPTDRGDHVSLELYYSRGRGYKFRALPFFDEAIGRKYVLSFGMQLVEMDYPCKRQSKKRYEEANESAFSYIHSDAGRVALADHGIELQELVKDREYDYYARR